MADKSTILLMLVAGCVAAYYLSPEFKKTVDDLISQAIPAEYGEWSEYSDCNSYGQKTRERECVKGTCDSSLLSEEKSCTYAPAKTETAKTDAAAKDVADKAVTEANDGLANAKTATEKALAEKALAEKAVAEAKTATEKALAEKALAEKSVAEVKALYAEAAALAEKNKALLVQAEAKIAADAKTAADTKTAAESYTFLRNYGSWGLGGVVRETCLAVPNNSTANELRMIGHTNCYNTPGQRWNLNPLTGELKNGLGKCLDVPGGQKANGIQINQYDCNGAVSLGWRKYGTDYIQNTSTGKCLTLSQTDGENLRNANGQVLKWGNPTVSSHYLTQEECSPGGTNWTQRWSFSETPLNNSPDPYRDTDPIFID